MAFRWRIRTRDLRAQTPQAHPIDQSWLLIRYMYNDPCFYADSHH